MKYFSAFSGIGGFEIGIQRAFDKQLAKEQQDWQRRDRIINKMGSDVLSTSGEPPLCVGYSEIDKYATKVYERKFNGHKNYGDITKINANGLPDFDFLVGGFPCQAFSIAGKRGGFSDTRGTLFFDLARILRSKRPRLFVFENVKGLLSHDGGRTFKTIVQTIDELGYDCQWQVLNSKNHGVPQNRERIIIVGHLRGTTRPQVFPITGSGEQTSKSVEVAGTLETDGWEKRFEQIRRVHSTDGISPTIPTAQGGGVMTKISVIAAQRGRYNDDGIIEQQLEPRFDGLSNTLTAVQKDNMLYSPKIRRLTPMECERLQGFPDNWTKFGVGDEPISDSQRYKMCGNAVTTNVIQAVFEKIFDEVR